MSFQLRLAVTVTAGIGTLFMLIAISTNHWVTGNGRDDVENVGLWKVCLRGVCVSHGDIIYSKILLVIAMLLGIFSSALIVLAQVYGVTDVKYQVAKLMFLTGLLALCGMIPATVFFVLIPYYGSISYGLVLGWISTVLYIAAGFVSWIHHKRDPDRDMTLDEMRRFASSDPPPPPYTAQPPPSVIIVS